MVTPTSEARATAGAASPQPVYRERIRRFFSLSFYDKLNLVELWLHRLKGVFFYRWIFKSFGRRSAIYPPTLIGHPAFIHIGDRVTIRKGVRLEAVMYDPNHLPEIHIGDDVTIEQDVHIVVLGKLKIHNSVTIAARSSILGGTHPFLDIRGPARLGDRLDGSQSFTEIGEGCLLGIGCVIHMNVRLGKHVVVGTNAVVKKSVPSYSVVDGNPAAVVLTYDHERERWARPQGRT